MIPRDVLLAAIAAGAAIFAGQLWVGAHEGILPWGLASIQIGIALGAILLGHQLVRVEPPSPPAELPAGEGLRQLALVRQERDAAAAELATVREMVEVTPNGLLAVGSDGVIRYANPALRRMLRVPDDPIGRTPVEVIRLAELEDAVESALRGTQREHRCAFGPTDLLVRSYPLHGSALVVVNDVTGYREAERSRTDFVANVSHELRTPLTAIMGFVETLTAERERLPADVAPLLEAVDRNSRRLANLFEDLLKLHRIEARRHDLPLEKLALRPILVDATLTAADTARAKQQDFRIECEPSVEAFVHEEALKTIVSNLATNAVNYTNSGGRVIVRVRWGNGAPAVEVQDDGIGIDAVHQERIYERFFRVDEARSRRAGGTGLGLAIVKHLTLATNGRLSLESAPGKGSTFRLQLPKTGGGPDTPHSSQGG
ncbi:MAG: PAS domain-containing protein [Deltaproteobacteria bacterium]|nr:PAS domain-containing protein [Deltaproteobacteria bacterium]